MFLVCCLALQVVRRQPSYAVFSGMCRSMCAQCVAAVQSCTLGAKQPLPQQCQTVQNFPVVLGVINEYLKQQTATEKGAKPAPTASPAKQPASNQPTQTPSTKLIPKP